MMPTPPNSPRWSDAFLDAQRTMADPETDNLMAEVFQSGSVEGLLALRPFLETWDAPPTADLPLPLHEFLARPVEFPVWVDQRKLDRAAEMFVSYGAVNSLLVLLSAFPHNLTNPSTARAFFLAQIFNPTTIKNRMQQLPHFIINITQRGGLEQTPLPGRPTQVKKGVGILTAQKLRLIHSSIRLRLQLPQLLPEHSWNAALLGQPNNQEDLTGAVLDFCFWVTDGLRQVGIELSREDEEARLHQWQTIGFLLGMRDEMQPVNLDDARLLHETIRRRRVQASPEGAAVMAELLRVIRSLLPPGYKSLPAGLLRYTLDAPTADMLSVPNPRLLMWFLTALRPIFTREKILAKLARRISPPLIRWLIEQERTSETGNLQVPAALTRVWH